MLQEGGVSKAQRNQQRTHIGIGGERLQGRRWGGGGGASKGQGQTGGTQGVRQDVG